MGQYARMSFWYHREVRWPAHASSNVRPASNFSRAISRNFLMDNLFCSIVDSLTEAHDLKGYLFNTYRLMP